MVVHDLVDHDIVNQRLGVRPVESGRSKNAKVIGSIRKSTNRHIGFRDTVSDSVQHPNRRRRRIIRGCGYVDYLAGKVQAKADSVRWHTLANRPEFARLQHDSIGNLILKQVIPIVAQIDITEIDCRWPGIVKFDPVDARSCITVGQQLIYQNACMGIVAGLWRFYNRTEGGTCHTVRAAGESRVMTLDSQYVCPWYKQVHPKSKVHICRRWICGCSATLVVRRWIACNSSGVSHSRAI